MTVILYPGDKVHLVVPGMKDRYGNPDNAANATLERSTRQLYADQGVDAAIITTVVSTSPLMPTVVAVFREKEKPKKAADTSIRWVFESFDELVEAHPRPSRGQSAKVGDVTYVAIDDRWCAL